MNFANIKINDWQQFEEIDIDLSSQITILTGANGSGKTTLLKLLAKHQGWQDDLLAVPKLNPITHVKQWISRFWKTKDKSAEQIIGHIKYSNGKNTNLMVPNTNNAQYQILIQNQEQVECFYIPSHRSISKYQKINSIPIERKTKDMAFNEVSNATKHRFDRSGNQIDRNSFLMKSILINWAIQGYGNKVMPQDQELINNYEEFKKVLEKVLPTTLGFEDFEIRDMEIVFICNDGNDVFILEAASGGISAIIDIAWQIYMYSTSDRGKFSVIIDEIENHLHPTMQRNILPNLLNAFPNVNFIVSTHSPLIVGSVKDSITYVLKYNEDNKVQSHKLNFNEHVKNAMEILDEVLGVSFTMPVWAEEKLASILEEYSSKKMSENDFSNLRNELQQNGLEKLMPHAIVKSVGGKND